MVVLKVLLMEALYASESRGSRSGRRGEKQDFFMAEKELSLETGADGCVRGSHKARAEEL